MRHSYLFQESRPVLNLKKVAQPGESDHESDDGFDVPAATAPKESMSKKLPSSKKTQVDKETSEPSTSKGPTPSTSKSVTSLPLVQPKTRKSAIKQTIIDFTKVKPAQVEKKNSPMKSGGSKASLRELILQKAVKNKYSKEKIAKMMEALASSDEEAEEQSTDTQTITWSATASRKGKSKALIQPEIHPKRAKLAQEDYYDSDTDDAVTIEHSSQSFRGSQPDMMEVEESPASQSLLHSDQEMDVTDPTNVTVIPAEPSSGSSGNLIIIEDIDVPIVTQEVDEYSEPLSTQQDPLKQTQLQLEEEEPVPSTSGTQKVVESDEGDEGSEYGPSDYEVKDDSSESETTSPSGSRKRKRGIRRTSSKKKATPKKTTPKKSTPKSGSGKKRQKK